MISRSCLARQQTAKGYHARPVSIINLVHGLGRNQLLTLILKQRQLFRLVKGGAVRKDKALKASNDEPELNSGLAIGRLAVVS